MRRFYAFVVVLITLLFQSGCATKIQVKALYPSDIDRAAGTKTIAVTEFKGDTLGVGGNFESKIAQQTLDGQPYFTVISRTDIDKVIKEQQFQGSGLLDESSSVNIGGLLGAQAIISGEVGNITKNDRNYFETRTKCVKWDNNKKCIQEQRYRVSCVERSVGLNVNIKMVDVEKGDIIYTDSFNKSRSTDHCSDSWGSLTSQSAMFNKIIENITTNFASKLTPKYVYFKVELLDDPDIEYSDNQKEKLKKALELMESERYDKAFNIFEYLVESTGERSYVALYNLGVTNEALGNLNEAQELYKAADGATDDNVDQINVALKRIKQTIAKRNRAMSQMNRE
jgi:hypothetical protein